MESCFIVEVDVVIKNRHLHCCFFYTVNLAALKQFIKRYANKRDVTSLECQIAELVQTHPHLYDQMLS